MAAPKAVPTKLQLSTQHLRMRRRMMIMMMRRRRRRRRRRLGAPIDLPGFSGIWHKNSTKHNTNTAQTQHNWMVWTTNFDSVDSLYHKCVSFRQLAVENY